LRTAAQAFKKFGSKLTIRDIVGKEITKLYYPESLKTKVDFKRGMDKINTFFCIEGKEIYGSYRDLSDQAAEKCQVEGCNATENLEVHHCNPQKNISKNLTAFEKSLIARKRKTVTLCHSHHKLLHDKKLI
jgi:hypothetical protein